MQNVVSFLMHSPMQRKYVALSLKYMYTVFRIGQR